ncbi:MAG TPA: methyltransferase domain-containing protein [Pyrinomonadaceae bacterium]|nr:methyltransferase domain-containing protein [Pyrinomonadaceae bacterium]
MQEDTSQVGYWDRVAPEKRFSHPLRLDWLEQYLPGRAASILDHGCGYGRTLAELSTQGYRNIFGADFSPAMLARSRNEIPNAKMTCTDGRSLPFADGSFDLVLLFAVLTCIPDDNDQRALLGEVERVLRPEGMLYISDLLVNTDARNSERYERFAKAHGCYGVFELPEGAVVRHHRKEWIAELANPFQQLAYEPFTVTTMNGNTSAAFQYFGRKARG